MTLYINLSTTNRTGFMHFARALSSHCQELRNIEFGTGERNICTSGSANVAYKK